MVNLDNIVPLPMTVMSDFHCHCDYSFDAVGSIDEYCRAALKRNLAELCFTTHCDLEPARNGVLKKENFIRIDGELKPHSVDLLAPYVDEVRAAHEKFYAEGLAVRLGIEFGWYAGCEETVENLRDKYDLEYVLCGVHNLDGEPLRQCTKRLTLEHLVESYFRHVVEAVSTGLFDSIAHFDYYKRHGLAVYGEDVRRAFLPYAEETFAVFVATDTCMEINTAALRHGHPDYYPGMDIVNRARKAGVPLRYVGSDAHTPEDVGFDFEAVEAVVPPFIVGREG